MFVFNHELMTNSSEVFDATIQIWQLIYKQHPSQQHTSTTVNTSIRTTKQEWKTTPDNTSIHKCRCFIYRKNVNVILTKNKPELLLTSVPEELPEVCDEEKLHYRWENKMCRYLMIPDTELLDIRESDVHGGLPPSTKPHNQTQATWKPPSILQNTNAGISFSFSSFFFPIYKTERENQRKRKSTWQPLTMPAP